MIQYVVVYQMSKEVAVFREPAVMGPFHSKDEAKTYENFLLGQGYRWVRISTLIPPIKLDRFIETAED